MKKLIIKNEIEKERKKRDTSRTQKEIVLHRGKKTEIQSQKT